MKKFNTPLAFALAPMLAMGCLLSAASAVSVDDSNILNGGTAVSSSAFGVPSIMDPNHVTDGSNSSFVFADDGLPDPSLSVSGFNSDIDKIRFFDTPSYGGRIAIGVDVHYSAVSQNSLDPNDYISAGSFVLPAIDYDAVINPPGDGSLDRYTMATDPGNPSNFPNPADPAVNLNAQISFAEISGLGIPAGTQSLLFVFDPSIFNLGLGLTEIQAYAIPEPTTMISLLIGAASVLGTRRRA